MMLLAVFLGGFATYKLYQWSYDVLPWFFPGACILGHVIPPEAITLQGFLTALLVAGCRDLLPLFVILVSYAATPLSRAVSSQLVPLGVDYPEIYSIVKDTASSLGLKAPETYVMNSTEPNAFVAGRRNKTAKLVLTTELLKMKDLSKMKPIITHELSHIINNDMVFMTWAKNFTKSATYWLPVVCLSPILENLIFNRYIFPSADQLTFVFINILFLGIIPFLLVNSISRVREFLADARTSLILKNPELLISALKEIRLMLLNSQITKSLLPSQLKIAPSIKAEKTILLAYSTDTHPSTEERCAALRTGSYNQVRPLGVEASIWTGIIVALVTGLFVEFALILRNQVIAFTLNIYIPDDAFDAFLDRFEILLPSVLISLSFMLGIEKWRLPKDSSLTTALGSYLKGVSRNVTIAGTVFLTIFLPWHLFFTTAILFQPFTAFWELGWTQLIFSNSLRPALFLVTAVIPLSFLLVMFMFTLLCLTEKLRKSP